MSSKTRTTATKEEATPALVPKLRFPEFRGAEAWHVSSLDSVCEILNNRRRPITGNERTPGPYPYYGASGIVDYVGGFIFDERLLLVGEDGAKWGAFEKTAFIADGKYWVNNHAHVLKPIAANDTLLENYLTMLDLSPFVTGAAPPKLTLGKLKGIPVPLPPKPAEQQKIAECLSSVDELMAAQALKVDALKTHKKGLMQQLFPREGETQPRLRFPEFQNAGEWERASLENVLDQISNGLSLTQGNESSLYRVTRIETISSGAIDLERVGYVDTPQDISAYKLNVGDILFSNINSVVHIGKSVFVDADYDLYHGMNLLRLVAKRSKCEPKFLFYLINTHSIRASFRERANKAVNQASINQTELGKTDLAFPALPEQQRIATCLSSLDALITAETQKHEALKTHKKGLMQQLFPAPKEVAG
jgi:type I restriction enzyme, S subunit